MTATTNAELAAFLRARVSEQTPDRPALVAKYQRLVAEHTRTHTCTDDDQRYEADQRCPWVTCFVTMWADHAQYRSDWSKP